MVQKEVHVMAHDKLDAGRHHILRWVDTLVSSSSRLQKDFLASLQQTGAPAHFAWTCSRAIQFWEAISASICFATAFAIREASASTVAFLSPALPVATPAAAEPTPIVAAAPGFLPLSDRRLNSESTIGCASVVRETVTCA